MSKKMCLINQPAGLGDILFCLKIAYHYHNLGYTICWPTIDAYHETLKKYIDCPFDFVIKMSDGIVNGQQLMAFPDNKHAIFSNDYVYLPLDACHMYIGGRIMEAKYRMAQIPSYKDWKDFFNIKRDRVKEEELFQKFNLKEDEEYALVNNWYGSPPGSLKMYADLKNINIKKVEVDYLEGYSIFDWSKIIEHATEICITDSSMALLVEKLKPTKVKDYTIILRNPTRHQVELMYELPWNYVVGENK